MLQILKDEFSSSMALCGEHLPPIDLVYIDWLCDHFLASNFSYIV